MAARAPIIAGRTVILLSVQDTVDSALNGVRSKLKKFSTSIGNIGLDLFRGGLVGTIPVAGILREFQTFEDKILFLATKVTATEKEFASLTETIRELGRTTSFTSQEVADGATILAQAGFNVREVKDSLQALLDLGRGGQLELGQAGAILANTIRSFSLETKDAANVASQFIVAARLGTLDVLDLKESIKEVLGTVRVLNIDLPTTLALLTQLAERSLKGTKAGTSLNTALLQLASKQDVIRKALKIPLPDSISGDSFIVFLQQLYDKLRNLSNLKQVAVLQSLFNIRGGRAITALDDIKKILDLQKAIRGAGNEAREAAVKMDSGFGGSIRRATSAVRDLSISLGGLAAGPLKVFLDTIPPLASSLNQVVTVFPKLTLAILATPPAFLLAGTGLLSLSFAMSKLAGVVGVLSLSFQQFGGFFFRGFSAQLTSGLVLINRFRRGLKQIDQGLGARLLGVEDPAKVIAAERRVANARKRLRAADIAGNIGAVRKAQRNISLSQGRLTAAKQSSFFGRVGATSLSGTGATARGIISLFQKAIPTLSRMNKGIVAVFGGLNRFNSVLRKLRPPLATIIRLSTILSTLTFGISTLSARDTVVSGRALIKSLQSIGFQVLKATNLFINFAEDTGTAIRRFTNISINFTQDIAKAIKALDAFTVINFIADSIVGSLTKLGSAFKFAFSAKGFLGKTFIRDYAFIVRLDHTIMSIRRNLAFGNLAGALDTKRLTKTFSLFKTTLSANMLGKTFNILRTGFIGIGQGLKVFTKVDYVRILFNIFRTTFSIAKGFLLAANAVRRFVFSFSGFFTIVELLIIFGSKIKFIREAFTRLGTGISKAFSTIIGTFKDATSSFNLFSEGIRTLIRGEGTLGISQLSQAFSTFGTILRSNLVIAWEEFVIAIAPAYDFLRKMIVGVIELGKLFANLFGSTVGVGLGGIGDIIASSFTGKSLTESISEAFKASNFTAFFSTLGVALTGTFDVILDLARGSFNIVAETMLMIQKFLESIGGGFQAFRNSTPEEIAAGSGILTQVASGSGATRKIIEDINKRFATGLDSSTKGLTAFTDALKVFELSTEAAAKNTREEAESNKNFAKAIAAGRLRNIKEGEDRVERGDKRRAQLLGLTGILPSGFSNTIAEKDKTITDLIRDKQTEITSSANTRKSLLAIEKSRLLGVGVDKKTRENQFFSDLGTKAKDLPQQLKQIGDTFPIFGQTVGSVLGILAHNPTQLLDPESFESGTFLNSLGSAVGTAASTIIGTIAGTENQLIAEKKDRLAKRKEALLGIRNERFKERELRREAALLKLQQRFGRLGIPQAGSIADVVSATVGSIQTTRFNKFKALGDNPQKQTNDLLTTISGQLGSEAGNSYLKTIAEKAGPLVFQ